MQSHPIPASTSVSATPRMRARPKAEMTMRASSISTAAAAKFASHVPHTSSCSTWWSMASRTGTRSVVPVRTQAYGWEPQ